MPRPWPVFRLGNHHENQRQNCHLPFRCWANRMRKAKPSRGGGREVEANTNLEIDSHDETRDASENRGVNPDIPD